MLIMAVAFVGTIYMIYPTIPHAVPVISIGSSVSTSTYTSLSFSARLTENTIYRTVTSVTCRLRHEETQCSTQTLVTTSVSSFHTTELVFRSKYNQLTTYSYPYTASRNENIPPYAYVGLSTGAFAVIAIAGLGLVGGVIVLLFRRRPAAEKSAGPPHHVEPPKALPSEPTASPKGGDAVRLPRLAPIVTFALIALNVFFFILEEAKGGSQTTTVLIQMGAVTSSTFGRGEYFRILLAPFLHIGPDHLISNMYALFFIGWALERVYGHVRFAVVYLLSGLVGSLLSAMTIPIGVISAGASGAILGCLVALVVLQLQFSHVSFGLGVGSAVLALFYNLLTGLVPGSGIDNAAHFGGAAGGLVLSLVVPPPSELYRYVAVQIEQTRVPKYGMCPVCLEDARQTITRDSVYYVKGLGRGWPCRELTCEKCKSVLYDYKQGQSFVIPLCQTCQQPLELRDPEKLTWFCRNDDSTFATQPMKRAQVADEVKMSHVLRQETTTPRQISEQRTGRRNLRIALAGAVIIFALLGALAFASYPRLVISDANLSMNIYSSMNGYVTIQIGGSGTFFLQSLTATLAGSPLSVGYTAGVLSLPHQVVLHVTGTGYLSLLMVAPTLTVTVDGAWLPIANMPMIPVHITAQMTLQRR
jgi:membrane associated rhomboid family serine protease